jgi:hypothetical protein
MSDRTLWLSVVAQAAEDLDGQPYGSLLYEEAVAFFTANNTWAISRREIADNLDMHADDLKIAGTELIRARHLRDGLPPPVVVVVRVPRAALVPPPTVLRVFCPPPPRVKLTPRKPRPAPATKHVPWTRAEGERPPALSPWFQQFLRPRARAA